MKMNDDCTRDILGYLVKNLTIEIKNNSGTFSSLSILDVMKEFETTYTQKDIWYTIYNLSQDRFIESDDIRRESKKVFAFVEIYNVTHRGHLFNESIQPQPIWDKTKGVVSKVGVHTLGFVESVARDVAVESAKKAIAISMGQPTA